jgi:hypothetical protein
MPDTRHPILAIGRTGDSQVRRIAMLTMFESLYVPHPAESAIWRDILRRSRRRIRNDVTLVTVAAAAFGSEGMKAAVTNAPMFAHATEALMSRLPNVNG